MEFEALPKWVNRSELCDKQEKGLVALLKDLYRYKPKDWQTILNEALDGGYSNFDSESFFPTLDLLNDVSHKKMKKKIQSLQYAHDFVHKKGEKTKADIEELYL
jgi:hypothetical protein